MSNSDTVLLSFTYICMSRWFVFFVRYFNFHILPDATCFDVYSISFPFPPERSFDPHNVNAWRASLCHGSWSKISYSTFLFPILCTFGARATLFFISIKRIKCLGREKKKKKRRKEGGELINSLVRWKLKDRWPTNWREEKCVRQR